MVSANFDAHSLLCVAEDRQHVVELVMAFEDLPLLAGEPGNTAHRGKSLSLALSCVKNKIIVFFFVFFYPMVC